jgi:hypothetical protein
MKQLAIDGETADRITVLTLKDYAKYLRKELKQFKKGEYLHPEDVAGNIKRIEAIEFILKDFPDVTA